MDGRHLQPSFAQANAKLPVFLFLQIRRAVFNTYWILVFGEPALELALLSLFHFVALNKEKLPGQK